MKLIGISIFPNLPAVRSGDYYLFEDLDEKVELDLLHERPSAGIDDAMTDKKMSDKMTIEQVNESSILMKISEQIPNNLIFKTAIINISFFFCCNQVQV